MRKMPSAPIDLPDVNVWLNLADQHHAHHARAQRYWDEEAAPQIAFCRITMLGLLRLGTNPRAMTRQAFTPAEVWHAYRVFRLLPEVTFLDEPPHLEAQMAAWSDAPDFPVHAWTDCYLASIALLGGCRLVSFDRDFRRFTGLYLLLLEP